MHTNKVALKFIWKGNVEQTQVNNNFIHISSNKFRANSQSFMLPPSEMFCDIVRFLHALNLIHVSFMANH